MKKRIIQLLIAVCITVAIPFISPNNASAATSNEIAAYAKKFYGTAYKFGGNTPAGFDCSGYIRYVYDKFGVNLPRTSSDQFGKGKAISKDKIQPGDLVFFANTYKKGISHTGIYLGKGEFISAKSRGVMKANLNTDPYWAPKYAGAKRIASDVLSSNQENIKTTETMSEIFTDLSKKHPAYDAIISLNERKIINGYIDATFKPEQSITRGQAAAMINRVLKLEATSKVEFTDVSSNYAFSKDVAALSEAGILQGYQTGKFGVNDTLTRAHLAAIVDRAFGFQGKISKPAKAASVYEDVPRSHWAFESIHALKSLDKTEVFDTSKFYLGKAASRAEFSAAVFTAISDK